MSKLKNIIKQLSEKDYLAVFESLMDSNADKSASLLKYLKEKQLSDNKIMSELDVNPNAYYTLRSRLNEKIEEYLVKEMESPKADILKKVANINELVFTKKKTLVIATLKKLEKELVDFDLSNELIIVYKNLKKLHINTPEHYFYSQLYNKHIAYTLALDKAEDILGDYFKKYGQYFLTGEEIVKTELSLLKKRLEIYLDCINHIDYMYIKAVLLFSIVSFVEPSQKPLADEETIEQNLEKLDKIFETYEADANYHHLRLVFDFLKLEYYNFIKAPKKADKYLSEVNEYASLFLSNYSLYTFPSIFLISKLHSVTDLENSTDILEENKVIYAEYESDPSDIPKYIVYHTYRALCYFYAEKYDQAAKTIHNILNETTLKKYPDVQLEIKTFLALQYCLLKDDDLFNQLMNSIQRQIRLHGKKRLEHLVSLSKAMKLSLSGTGKLKPSKLKMLVNKVSLAKVGYYSPLNYIRYNDNLVHKLSL